MAIRSIVLDIGETLVDETRSWAAWADWLGVTHLAFFAALGAVITAKQHHNQVFEMLRPGIDLAREKKARQANGGLTPIEARDLYPDVVPTLTRLRAAGFSIGLAGNQPTDAETELKRIGLGVDFVASSARWGVQKPDLAFFSRVVGEAGVPAEQIAYVGDRLDNDVLPAMAMGMIGVFVRRGPWGMIHATWPEVTQAHLRLESLSELPEALAHFRT